MSKEIITYYTHKLTRSITVNNRLIKQVDISSHCDKHFERGITHGLIMELVELLDRKYFPPDGPQPKDKRCFRTWLRKGSKDYKLVWWWWSDKNYSILYVRTCHPI